MGRKALPIAAAAPLTEAVEQLHRKKKIAKKQMKLTISFEPCPLTLYSLLLLLVLLLPVCCSQTQEGIQPQALVHLMQQQNLWRLWPQKLFVETAAAVGQLESPQTLA